MEVQLAYVLVFFVALIATATSLITKKTLFTLHAAQFNVGRGIIDLVLLAILAPFLLRWPGIQAIGIIAFIGLIAAVGSILVLKSMRHKGISEITPLYNLSPFFLVIFAYFLLGERLELIQYIGIAILLFGAYFLQADKNDFLKPFKLIKNKYFLFMLVALIIYSATATMEKSILGIIVEPLIYLWWIRLFLAIYFIIFELIMYGTKEIKSVLQKNWKEIGLVQMLGWVDLGLLYIAIPMAPISTLIPIKRTSTLFTTIFGGKFFHEGQFVQRLIACAVMLLGAVFIII